MSSLPVKVVSRKEAYRLLCHDEEEGRRRLESRSNLDVECFLRARYKDSKWIVGEWCPVCDTVCQYRKVAPLEEIRKKIEEFQEKVQGGGYVQTIVFSQLYEELSRRSPKPGFSGFVDSK